MDPECFRCGTDFPISNAEHFKMGLHTEVKMVPAYRLKINDWNKEQYGDVIQFNEKLYLCGNCYFDLTEGPEDD